MVLSTYIPFQVIWSILFNPKSAGDKGALYSAKNFLNAKNVPVNPMHDIDATFDFIQQYTEALVIAVYEEIKIKHQLNMSKLPDEQEVAMDFVLEEIVSGLVMPSISVDFTGSITA